MCDSDDWVEPDMFSEMYQKANEEIYVEDDLAQAIARQVVLDEDMLNHVSFHKYRVIKTPLSLLPGLTSKKKTKTIAFIMDGDKYHS